jgi:hypothetical protein
MKVVTWYQKTCSVIVVSIWHNLSLQVTIQHNEKHQIKNLGMSYGWTVTRMHVNQNTYVNVCAVVGIILNKQLCPWVNKKGTVWSQVSAGWEAMLLEVPRAYIIF